MSILIGILLAIHVVVCLFMVLIILMQRTKQEGLGAAFGGGFTDSMFGAQTSQVLVKATVWLAGFFFILTIALAHLYNKANTPRDSEFRKQLLGTPAQSVSPVVPPDVTTSTPAATASTPATPAPVAPATPTQPAKK